MRQAMTGAEDLSGSVTVEVYVYANRIKTMAAGQREASRIGSRNLSHARGHEAELSKKLRSVKFLTIFFDGGKNHADARANDFLCGLRTSGNEERFSLPQGFEA
jgi:hypothetical protein